MAELLAFRCQAGAAFEFFEGKRVQIHDCHATGEAFADTGHEGKFLRSCQEILPGPGARGIDPDFDVPQQFWSVLDFIDDHGWCMAI